MQWGEIASEYGPHSLPFRNGLEAADVPHRLSSCRKHLAIECIHGPGELCLHWCVYPLRNAFGQVQTERDACGHRQCNTLRLIAFEILGKRECGKSTE